VSDRGGVQHRNQVLTSLFQRRMYGMTWSCGKSRGQLNTTYSPTLADSMVACFSSSSNEDTEPSNK